MTVYGRLVAGLGRTLLSIIFIVVGLSQIFYWEQADKDLSYALANWEIYSGNADNVGEFFSELVAMVPALLIIGIVLQLLGGILLFFNVRVRFAAFLLLIYVFCATATYHPFWYLDGPVRSRSLILFLKNLGIFGGLLVVLGMGKGVRKMDRVRVKKKVRREIDEDEFDDE